MNICQAAADNCTFVQQPSLFLAIYSFSTNTEPVLFRCVELILKRLHQKQTGSKRKVDSQNSAFFLDLKPKWACHILQVCVHHAVTGWLDFQDF